MLLIYFLVQPFSFCPKIPGNSGRDATSQWSLGRRQNTVLIDVTCAKGLEAFQEGRQIIIPLQEFLFTAFSVSPSPGGSGFMMHLLQT